MMDAVDNMDKENITVLSKSTSTMESSGTPKRLPLKNVTFNEANSRLTSSYSPLTPIMMKTHINQRKSIKLKTPLPVYCDNDQSEPSQLLQKTLMKKHVKDTIKQTKEKYESQLSAKDSIIKELQEKLAAAESVAMDTNTTTGPDEISTEENETETGLVCEPVLSSCVSSTAERDICMNQMSYPLPDDCDYEGDALGHIDATSPENTSTDMKGTINIDVISSSSSVSPVAEKSILQLTSPYITSSIEYDENLGTGNECTLCSTDKDDCDDDVLPSDSELDKFVTEILETCVQSINDDQNEIEINRIGIHVSDNVTDTSQQQGDLSINTGKEDKISDVNSISQTVDHSYCRLAEKGDKIIHSISDNSATELDHKSILVKSVVDLVNTELVCASEVTCSSGDLDSSIGHCKGGEVQALPVKTSDMSCSPMTFATCENKHLTSCELEESGTNISEKHEICLPLRHFPADQCCTEERCLKDLDTNTKHLELTDSINSPMRILGCDKETLAVWDTKDADTSTFLIKLSDTANSPVKFPGIDQGTMALWETQDADTSMEQVQMRNALLSPIQILTEEIGTMASWETQDANTSVEQILTIDVSSSPMKFLTQEQGVLVKTDVVDADTSMVHVEQLDADTSMVHVGQVDADTSMDHVEQVDADTSMVHVEQVDADTSMDHVEQIDADTSMIHVERVDADTSMVHVEQVDADTSMVHVEQIDADTSMIHVEQVDADTSMVHVEQIDAESMAVPSSEERYTMTDHGMSVNKETAMTPIKISHKSGQHRMTLQDIRSQHPRVVANHIDTLTLELQRIKKENHDLKSGTVTVTEPEKRKPSTSHYPVTATESVKRKPSTSHCTENKLEKTKAPISRLPVVKRQEKPAVQKKASAKTSVTEKSQNREQLAVKEKEKVAEMRKLKTDYEAELENLRSTLVSSQESNLKMEELYQSTSADLRNSNSRVQILQASVEKLQNALQEANKDKAAQLDRIQDMSENDRAAFLEIQTLNAVIKTQDQHLKEFANKLSQSEEQRLIGEKNSKVLEEKIAEQEAKDKTQSIRIRHLQDEITEYKLGITNLQRTLDFREEEIDRNEKELFNFREGFVDIESEMEKVSAENAELRECSAVMQGKFQELKSSYQRLQSEMEAAQTSARRMLEGKEVEVSAARGELENLAQKMQTVLNNLKEGIGESTPEKQDISLNNTAYGGTTNRPHPSLVSQILSAAHNQTNKPSDLSTDSLSELESPTVVDDAIDHSAKKTFVSCFRKAETAKSSSNSTSVQKAACDEPIDLSVFSSRRNNNDNEQCSDVQNNFVDTIASTNELRLSSAFEVVRDRAFQPKLGPIKSNSLCSNIDVTDSVLGSYCEESLTSQDVSEEETSLADYIISMKEMFVEIIRVANMLETATQLSIGDLKEENENLRNQLRDLRKKECYMKAELEIKKKDITEGRQQVSDLEQSLQRMADNMMRFSNQESIIKNLTAEVISLKRKLSSVEADKVVLENHARELSSHNNGCSKDDAHLRSQILALTRKNRKLQEKLIHQQEYFEDMETKAATRMKTLKENWKKADEEVYRFDELVEKIRETLERNSAFLESNQELKEMVQMIDGQSDFPSSVAPLQPIKTAIF